MTYRELDYLYLKSLAELEKKCFSDPWSEGSLSFSLDSPYNFVYGAFDKEKLVGYVILFVLFETSEIQNLAVEEGYRRQGIGGILLEKAEEEARKREAEKLSLEVRESNLSAKSLYESRGFLPVGKRKNYYKFPMEDAVLMEKVL